MKILITGGSGFIGSAVCKHFAKEAANHVINLDLLTYAAVPEALADINDQQNYTFIEGSINNRKLIDEVMAEYKIDAVLHLAAESHVDRSIDKPDIFLQTNIMGTHCLLEASTSYLQKYPDLKKHFRFLHVSTDEVYGDLKSDEPGFTEDNNYRPSSPYSASKAAADHLVYAWFRTYGLPVLLTHCSNTYGPWQNFEKLIPHMVACALNKQPMPLYGNGKNIRDWIHVSDHVTALEIILKKGAPGNAYNIGGECEKTNLEIVKMICKTLDKLVPADSKTSYEQLIKYVDDRPGHDYRYAMDTNKLRSELGWQPKIEFNMGLQETVQWYVENQNWLLPQTK